LFRLLLDVTSVLIIHSILELVLGVRLFKTRRISLKHVNLLRY
jgi:hypothetical protein